MAAAPRPSDRCHKCQLRFLFFVPINVGWELSLGFTRPVLVREHSLAPVPCTLGIGATHLMGEGGGAGARPR